MSRAKNNESPFYATALSRMKPGHSNSVRGMDRLLRRSGLTLIWPGSGWRPNSQEHSNGAIDWMITDEGKAPSKEERRQGELFLAFLVSNHRALGIRGILHSRDGKARTEAIGYSQMFSKGWRSLENRKSNSANHVDHIHIAFNSDANWPKTFENLKLSDGGKPTPVKPGLPSTGAPGKPVTLPFPNSSTPSAVSLQRQLKKAGFMPHAVAESANYGPKTQQAVRAFHTKHPEFASNSSDIEIGPKGWEFLFTLSAPQMPAPKPAPPAKAPTKHIPGFPNWLQANKSTPSARSLQVQLKKAGFLSSSVKENDNYGPQTQQAVIRFHNKHPQFKAAGVAQDRNIGPKGWAYLFEKY